MYMTRLHLDPYVRKVILGLENPNLFHGAIEKARPGKRTRILWRIDKVNGQYYLLILSEQPLETRQLEDQFGMAEEQAQVKKYDEIFRYVTPKSRWRFRLCANPVKWLPSDGRGQVAAHVSPKWQMSWLKEQAAKRGFAIDESATQVTGSRWVSFRKKDGQHISLKQVSFEGILTVEDSENFCNALRAGVGRGKAYGMGMLTIAPL